MINTQSRLRSNYAFGAGAASSFGGAGTSFTPGAAGAAAAGAALPQQLAGAEQQVAAGLQQLTVLIWHGAGAQAVAHGAGAAWAQQVGLQHLTFGALQHLGLQQ